MTINRKNERGITIIVVAFTLVAILAMAALAIDVAELYVARGEAQRAANAGALAGAKMFVTSGYTSVQGSGLAIADLANVCVSGGPGLPQPANAQAEAAVSKNSIAGQPAVVTNIQCPAPGAPSNTENPTISVKVTRASVPTFFARIWGRTGTTVSATAVAEAFNPSGTSITPATTPIATAVKPWLVPNCNPTSGCGSGPYFVDPSSGKILQNGSFIGQTIDLNIITTGTPQGKPQPSSLGALDAYAIDLPNPPQPVCPACALSQTSYGQGIACASQQTLSCQTTVGRGTNYRVNRVGGVSAATTNLGARCLIHASNDGLGNGQDQVLSPGPPAVIAPGDNNPNPNFDVPNINISRSDSVVTLPLYDGTALCTGGKFGGCTMTKPVIGFLQVAITQTLVPAAPGGPGPSSSPQIEAVIINAAGCGNSSSGTPVSGSGTTPVPVRLIQNPTP